MLTVAAYGRYQLMVTAAAMVAQVALLGTPQTVVRYAGQRLPTRLLTAHTAALAVAAIALAVAAVPTLRSSSGATVLAALAVATIAAALLGAGAKARFAFRTSFVGEAAGAGVLAIAATLAITSARAGEALSNPTRAVLVEATALAVTMLVLLRAHRPPARDAEAPARRAVLANVYSVGTLVMLDVVVFRRLEVYFLERSPDGLAGVAVLGLSLQIATVALLVPTALLEAWQPRFALLANDARAPFDLEVARRRRQFVVVMSLVVVVGVAVPLVAVPLIFPQYRPWLGFIVTFVAVRIICASAGFYSAVLYAAGGHRALYVPAAVAAIVAVAGNAALTRSMGLSGAAIAYTITQVTLATLTVMAFHKSASQRRGVEGTVPAAA
jgi:O-antigen/teichoic acid export membrane protein